MRILDLDLDFFPRRVAHFRGSESGRLPDDDYPVWEVDDALGFLRERCGLTGPLPGLVVEDHGDLFAGWRQAIEDGHLADPFDVTHVDAHADLGLGDSGYVYLLTELMHEDVEGRLRPREGPTYLNGGNYLAFAAACRWLASLTYVYNSGGGSDVMPYVMEGFDPRADHLRLAALSNSHIEILNGADRPAVESGEPRVPFKMLRWDTGYQGEEPFEVVCLARSPAFKPPAADGLFDAIRETFIDEHAWRR